MYQLIIYIMSVKKNKNNVSTLFYPIIILCTAKRLFNFFFKNKLFNLEYTFS